jgi:Acetyltransferase (GNAT) domain
VSAQPGEFSSGPKGNLRGAHSQTVVEAVNSPDTDKVVLRELPFLRGNEKVTIVDPICDSQWDKIVFAHPDCTLFHTSAWAKVLCQTYGHRSLYLKISQGGGSVALMPLMEVASSFTGRRGVCLPFSDFCQPLTFGKWGQMSLTDILMELGRDRKWRYFELRGGKEMLPPSVAASERYYGHRLDLTLGAEQIFTRFRSPVRRAIRKAKKSGLVVETTDTRQAILNFYQLHVRTRRRHGVPPQPLSFFLNIHERIIKAGLGFVVLAQRATRSTAGAVFFYSRQAGLYKFGASDERDQASRGNNLVMWEGIKRLISNGVKTLDFGRTAINENGLRRFKLSWGTDESIIEYFKFALGRNVWVNNCRNAHGFSNGLFRRLPLRVNRLAGALVYPHLD